MRDLRVVSRSRLCFDCARRVDYFVNLAPDEFFRRLFEINSYRSVILKPERSELDIEMKRGLRSLRVAVAFTSAPDREPERERETKRLGERIVSVG